MRMRKSITTKVVDRNARLNTERREVILDAAQLVFDAEGLRNASLRQIAKAAGCTTGAIYPYFKGKEEIYGELLRKSLLALLAYILKQDQQSATAKERFMGFARFYIQHPADFSLGLYLYDQGAPIGVGRNLNSELNRLLLQIIRAVISGDPEKPGSPEQEATIFSVLMGLLISHFTDRLSLFGAEIEPLCEKAFISLKQNGMLS
ncbi:MAG: TetR/AcrR family transcriptional regulator [Rhizobiales bacterium]|nr:TetR/AcrR family transcriptional regulator [Hyphomicrobiales bacterium]